MNVEQRLLSQLKVYENNPRQNGEAVAFVKKSIESYGYKVPIVIDRTDHIVAGHTRFAALLQINRETGKYDLIQVVIADDLTEEEVKQFRIVDNSVAQKAEWDFTKLQCEIDSIDGFDIDDFGGIEGFDLDFLNEEIPIPKDENKIKLKIGPDTIEMTEAEYHAWATYVLEKGTSVIEFVTKALEINSADRHYPNLEL